ncbi:MAG: hypothetical protein KDA32_04340 [Phycisphaerales bacterium]|nr:hypothetical protein [Phycisphaerales bacterium]
MRPFTLFAILVAASSAFAQSIGGDVKSVGFRGQADMSQFVIRLGQWTPICVDLQGTSPTAQEFEVRFANRDLDGDTIEYSSGRVTVGAGMRRVWVYANLEDHDLAGQSVQVLDADGALVTRLTMPYCEALSDSTQLVVDVSRKPLLALTARTFESGGDWDKRKYFRGIRCGRMELSELPDRWIGLQAVDVIVWDEPKPTDLTIAQTASLIEWVRNGGELVLGMGPSTDDLRNTPLAVILPVRGDTPPEMATPDNLGGFVLQKAPRQMLVSTMKAREGAQVRHVAQAPPDKRYDFIVSWPVGSGRVTICAARLSDVVPESATPRDGFFEALFDVTQPPPGIRGAFIEKSSSMLMQAAALHAKITAITRFSGQTSLLMLLALAFVGVYIFVATGASWLWLRRRNLTSASWTIFAGVAVIAGVASLGAVRLTKGSGARSMSFVDCETGSPIARAWSYFGYRTAQRRLLKLQSGGDNGYVRPMAIGRDPTSSYATAARYDAFPARGELDSVPMRATLKQFDGFWTADLGGAFSAQLVADRATGELTTSSWISNRTDVEIKGGFLLYLDPRVRDDADGGPPMRAAGLTNAVRSGRRYRDVKGRVPPSLNVLIVPLPAMKPGDTVRELGADVYANYRAGLAAWRSREAQASKRPELPTLFDAQIEWAQQRFLIDLSPETAALLASTRDLYLPCSGYAADFDNFGVEITLDGIADMDITHWLSRDHAVLLLRSDTPAPNQLLVDGDPARMTGGLALYRVRAPVQYQGSVRNEDDE